MFRDPPLRSVFLTTKEFHHFTDYSLGNPFSTARKEIVVEVHHGEGMVEGVSDEPESVFMEVDD